MSKFQEAIQQMKEKRDKTIKEIAMFVEAESKLRSPVDTGHLRRSISHETESDEEVSKAFVGTNVEYAPVVEMGSVVKNIKAQPFLRPSIEENLGAIQDIIKKGMST
ncbi:HK97-gp10 family putative phage morphogenesis protein [Schinkia azotoformans]|uniref:HK97-gp10 family putative phage morphogenesis protein n=1 Tax=Schinkia azotoformans TaxID=1454 RepID=UPI002DB9FC9C|nr:HK97-gp10 family putative phage morphogenesis protein [Schinkia azotoformans]MEC1768285.1 HK97 gp10 family phage protein [Schinkia azotoformans]